MGVSPDFYRHAGESGHPVSETGVTMFWRGDQIARFRTQ